MKEEVYFNELLALISIKKQSYMLNFLGFFNFVASLCDLNLIILKFKRVK